MRYVLIAVALMVATASAQVKITVDRNTGAGATATFKFEHVPSPARDDAGAKAQLLLVAGDMDPNGADMRALTDGVLPTEEDEPLKNFFFDAGTRGGRFRLDMGNAVKIEQVNTYSWHPNTRGPQVYLLYGSDGVGPKFCAAPRGSTDPATCGWKLIASVDTRPKQGSGGGQYGVSITDGSGSLGKFRYLLFDCAETESEDDYGNTFYSEIDVILKK